MADQELHLRWSGHQSSLISVFCNLLDNEALVDCTIAADGHHLKAHKVVLCASSPYFESLLGQHLDKHPILILKDVKLSELRSLMDYMYRGEVNIHQDQLESFLTAAKSLKIKGLSVKEADKAVRNIKEVGSKLEVHQGNLSETVSANNPNASKRPYLGTNSQRTITKDGELPSLRRKMQKRSNVEDLHTSHSLGIQRRKHSIPDVLISPSTSTSSFIENLNIKQEHTETVNEVGMENFNKILYKSKPSEDETEPLLEIKAEYVDDFNIEDSDYTIEDSTEDNDEDGVDFSPSSTLNITLSNPFHVKERTGSDKEFAHGEKADYLSETEKMLGNQEELNSVVNASKRLKYESNGFGCSACGKSYKHKGNLIKHQRYECGEKKPFSCPLCDFACKQKGNLKKHIIYKHE